MVNEVDGVSSAVADWLDRSSLEESVTLSVGARVTVTVTEFDSLSEYVGVSESVRDRVGGGLLDDVADRVSEGKDSVSVTVCARLCVVVSDGVAQESESEPDLQVTVASSEVV